MEADPAHRWWDCGRVFRLRDRRRRPRTSSSGRLQLGDAVRLSCRP